MSETLPASLLEITLRNLRTHVQRLEADKSELERHIAEVRANIRQLEEQARSSFSPVNGTAAGESPRQRRPRGENLRLVRELFEQNPEAAFTIQEIADRTGVHISSVQGVLKREDAGFTKNLDGKWQRSHQIELSAPTPAKPR